MLPIRTNLYLLLCAIVAHEVSGAFDVSSPASAQRRPANSRFFFQPGRRPTSVGTNVAPSDDDQGTTVRQKLLQERLQNENRLRSAINSSSSSKHHPTVDQSHGRRRRPRVVVIGAGWGGLSAAHALSKHANVTVIEAAPTVGGLVRNGFTTITGQRPAEAGQHGFWHNYHNIFRLLDDLGIEHALTSLAEQGQYSPRGLEAVWPVFRDQPVPLPTGLAQAVYTRFANLPIVDRLTAVALVGALAEFDNSPAAWAKYDGMSFRDLCVKLGVSQRCYDEVFEPMILTGLFAPGAQCSAAAALGMAYFFVLQSQEAFDVQWCRGDIGDVVFAPWVQRMQHNGVQFQPSTRVTGFTTDPSGSISRVHCNQDHEETVFACDKVIFAVGASALNAMVRGSPQLAQRPEFRQFANLRGTSVLATRLFLDRNITIPYSANACWGFDRDVGMTMFDIRALHGANGRAVADARAPSLR